MRSFGRPKFQRPCTANHSKSRVFWSSCAISKLTAFPESSPNAMTFVMSEQVESKKDFLIKEISEV